MRGKDTQKNKSTKLADEYKDSCPIHRRKDLESLIKEHNGNRDKILEQIQIWWDEPQKAVEEWEDVGKKSKKQTRNNGSHNGGDRGDRNDRGGDRGYHGRGGGRGGYRSGDRGGRGGFNRGMNGGRGGGADRDRRNRDREGRNERHQKQNQPSAPQQQQQQQQQIPQEKKENAIAGPAPVKTERPLQGAWGTRAAAPAAPGPAVVAAPPSVVDLKPVVEPEPVFDVGVVTAQDPTPAGFVESNDVLHSGATPSQTTPTPKPAAPAGNVWATKGSAHIIQAEKPKPKPQPVSKPRNRNRPPKQQGPPQTQVEQQSLPTEIIETAMESNSSLPDPVKEDLIIPTTKTTTTTTSLESGLPASVNGANINAAGWKPMDNGSSNSVVDIVEPSPVGPVSVSSTPVVAEVPILETNEPDNEIIVPTEESAPVSMESSLKPASALNLGHWGETGDGEDNVSFGFGFGQENDVASVDDATSNNVTSVPQPTPATQSTSTDAVAAQTSTVSPARPPPGLGLGMPPMPDQIVHVHELENKLESASLAAKKDDVSEKVDITASANKDNATSTQSNDAYTSSQPVNNDAFVPMQPTGLMSQQNYSGQYGMGMYNYNGQTSVAAPNGFMGVPNPAAPLLSSGVLPQQPKQQTVSGQQQGVGLPQQGSLYGAPAPANPTTESSTNVDSTNPVNPSATNAGAIPPGMPAAGMPYNPALFYGQQPYQMGQHHGAYGFAAYGGQYGGVQGGGFGYQQVMGQGAGYQPYDQDHGSHGNNNNNHQGGYNKNNGGYRGRNNHNNHHHNQYQSQYNPQGHGGYGGQPYNMGYNDFNQRGGYGPGGHMESNYMQNSGGYQSGFNQDDGQQMSKGKNKGGNRNFGGSNPNNMHQYQSQPQQFGGLQGAGSGGVSGSTGNDTLNNYQNWGGGL